MKAALASEPASWDAEAQKAIALKQIEAIMDQVADICSRHQTTLLELCEASPKTVARELTFAQSMIWASELAREALAGDDTARAFNFGFKAAAACFQWQIEYPLGSDVARGMAQLRGASLGGQAHAGALRAAAASKKRHWQDLADKIWERKPGLKKSEVARIVAKSAGGNPNYIRNQIKKLQ